MKILKFFLLLFIAFSFVSCAAKEEKAPKYPSTKRESDERKSGRAMLFYDQAEEDADPENDVIVIPPPKKNKD